MVTVARLINPALALEDAVRPFSAQRRASTESSVSEEPVAARPGAADGGGGVGTRRGSAQQGPRREALRAGSLLPGACLSPETESSENAVVDAAPTTNGSQTGADAGMGACCSACEPSRASVTRVPSPVVDRCCCVWSSLVVTKYLFCSA